MMKKILFLLLSLIAVSASAQRVTEITGDNVRYNGRPIVIDIYASWCQPCRVYSPIFERVARAYAGRVDFYRLDCEDEDAIDWYIDNIDVDFNSVPTTVFLYSPYEGAELQSHVESGLLSYDELKSYVKSFLSKHRD